MASRPTLKHIQKRLFRTQLVLIVTLAIFLSGSGIALNLYFETQKRDQNLQNVAQTIARSPLVTENDRAVVQAYLDSLQGSLSDIDVISVISDGGTRLYHSNHSLIGTHYNGTVPQFAEGQDYYAANDTGPSGIQRRAYAAIYDRNGTYRGFVIAVMLMENIREETLQTMLVFLLITLAAIFMELMISAELSKRIKLGKPLEEPWLNKVLQGKQREFGIPGNIGEFHILADRLPIMEKKQQIGTLGILHNRTEYTKLMEDLSGTRYLVDSMRANNHDFTNKLHVILGLIQMEMYSEATDYIENITMVQRRTVSTVMQAVEEPAV